MLGSMLRLLGRRRPLALFGLCSALALLGSCGGSGTGGSSSGGGSTPPTPLSVTTSSLANAQVGVVYSTTLGATGGTAPYTWSLTSGILPPGISLDAATGALSGT